MGKCDGCGEDERALRPVGGERLCRACLERIETEWPTPPGLFEEAFNRRFQFDCGVRA